MQNPDLKFQSKGRVLEQSEVDFANTLEKIYAAGTHDFEVVVDELNKAGAPLPSGASGPWTIDVFGAELRAINAAHDAAYAENGFGA